MPSPDRQQATSIEGVLLAKAVSEIQASTAIQMAQQNLLLAELVKRNFKRPSVFQAGSFFDLQTGSNYVLQGSDAATLSMQKFCQGAQTSVYVLNIQDADVLRIAGNFLENIDSDNGIPPQFLIALSPSDAVNPIAASVFSPAGTWQYGTQGNVSVALPNTIYSLNAEIPCAGNKYAHLIVYIDEIDAVADFLEGGSVFVGSYIGYQLIK